MFISELDADIRRRHRLEYEKKLLSRRAIGKGGWVKRCLHHNGTFEQFNRLLMDETIFVGIEMPIECLAGKSGHQFDLSHRKWAGWRVVDRLDKMLNHLHNRHHM